MATGQAPVLETLAEINGASLARTELDVQTLLLVRVAALVAADAPAASYLMHIAPLVVSNIELESIQDVLVAVAPIVGAPRIVSAAEKIMEALGVAIAISEAADADAAAADS
jgi:hypothetical protein